MSRLHCQYPDRNQAGRTLIELMCVIAIGALVYSQAMPSVNKIYQHNQATAGINWILGAVNFSRLSAVKRRVTVTLCPAESNLNECESPWQRGLIIFADFNHDAVLNGDDYLIQRVSADHIDGTLVWRSFQNKQYLQMTPFGHTREQNGNFVFCPATASAEQFARQLVINKQGRARLVHEKNAEGLPVGRYKGKPKELECPASAAV